MLGQLVGIGDDLLTIVEEDNRQGDLVALIALDLLDGDDIVGGDLVLLAAVLTIAYMFTCPSCIS